jgi:hypothetical protein
VILGLSVYLTLLGLGDELLGKQLRTGQSGGILHCRRFTQIDTNKPKGGLRQTAVGIIHFSELEI